MDMWLQTYGGEFALLALAHFIAVISPGPDFLVTLRQSIQRGKTAALWTSFGIGVGILVHVAYIIFGMAVLLRNHPEIMRVFQWVGAAYLLWLAWQCLRSSSVAQFSSNGDAVIAEQSAWQAWRLGFLTNALNPKATMFFLALYVNIINAATPVFIQIGYGVWMSIVTGLWFSFVSYVMVQPKVRQKFLSFGPWVDRVLGVLLVIVAIRLLW